MSARSAAEAPKKQDVEVDEVSYSEPESTKAIEQKRADVTLKLMEEYGEALEPLTPREERKLVRKLRLVVLPIVFMVNFILFMDKNAMGYASLLGLFEDASLTQAKYNNLQTVFYAGYIFGLIPSHYTFQRVRVSRYVSAAVLFCSFLTLIQLVSYRAGFTGLAVTRFFMGVFESGLTPCCQHTLAMFFTPPEQAVLAQVFWISCLAVGLPGSLISYFIQLGDPTKYKPWQVYWAIIGGGSFLISVWTFFYYPDNPATFRLLSVEERVHVIRRIKNATHSSIEQKTVKKYQIIEALRDPISWLFGIHVFLLMFCNNISFQSAILYKGLGFSNLDSTLVSLASACWSVILSLVGCLLLTIFKAQSAHVGTAFCGICLLGGLLVVGLPWDKKYGILAGIFLTNGTGITYIAGFSWSQSSAAGYTKKLTRTVIYMVFYSVINLIASQFWRGKDAPRYYPAWITIIIGAWILAPLVLQVIRFILSRRNKERLKLLNDPEYEGDKFGYVEEISEDGEIVRKQVDVSMLDLTDLENKRFIYPL